MHQHVELYIYIYISPEKGNIFLAVKEKVSVNEYVQRVAAILVPKQIHSEKMLIFCRRYEDCYEFYRTFRLTLGEMYHSSEWSTCLQTVHRLLFTCFLHVPYPVAHNIVVHMQIFHPALLGLSPVHSLLCFLKVPSVPHMICLGNPLPSQMRWWLYNT